MKLGLLGSLICMVCSCCGDLGDADVHEPSTLPGHMKPFGSAGPFFEVPIIQSFPSPRDFFDNYVVPSIPVVMRNAAKKSPAFHKWTDKFFVEHPESSEEVYVENAKKEVRTAEGNVMQFRDFVKQYKSKDIYMVNGVPMFLRSHVTLPQPLKCKIVVDNLSDSVMWFSSGGTKSVLHNDDVDNINCLYRGNKTLTFVSRFETGKDWTEKVLDKSSGSYSSMDVDAVDYTKYPQLAGVRFGVVHMQAGDCLFIPYKWLHQVNSFGNNLAVNLWFKHHPRQFYNLSAEACGNFSDEDLFLNQVVFETTDLHSGQVASTIPVFDKNYTKNEHEIDEDSAYDDGYEEASITKTVDH